MIQQTPPNVESDAALLARFASVRDEAAFAELMRRHGPMVLGVSARRLRQAQDAEDVLQAVFLTLSARARSLRRVRSVAGWLHNVAVRISLNQQKMNRRREEGLRRYQAARHDSRTTECHELNGLLDEELARLPARLKEIVVLRDLEGYSRSEIANKLGLAAGTVASRLDRGRKLLRKRLVRRGVTLGAGGVAAALAHCATAGHVLPPALIHQTLRMADLFLLGTSVSGVPAIAKITSLAQGELNRMFLTKLSTTVGVAALALALVLGASPVSKSIGLVSGARASTILFDDFEDGSVTDGSPVRWQQYQMNGTTSVVAGDHVLSGTGVTSFPDEPGDSFRDGSVRSQLRFLQSTNSAFAYVAARSPNAAGYLGGVRQDGLIAIVESFDGAPFQIHSEIATSLNPVARDVVLQLDTIGNRISLSAWHAGDPKPAQPQLVVFDNTLSFGGVGVGIAHDTRVGPAGFAQVAFRDFTAVPEPTTIALGSLGFVALASLAFRTRLRRVG